GRHTVEPMRQIGRGRARQCNEGFTVERIVGQGEPCTHLLATDPKHAGHGMPPTARERQIPRRYDRAMRESAAARAWAVSGALAPDDRPIIRRRHGDADPLARSPLVVDLSSLWAGPLCARVLAGLGARVIKVESRTRPDGARFGPPAFFEMMHRHTQCVALD